MAQALAPGSVITPTLAFTLENETKPKFLALNIFWIKVADFMDIVPRHPHLLGLKLSTRDFVLEEMLFGRGVSLREGLGGGGGGDQPLGNVEVKEEGHSPLGAAMTNGTGTGTGAVVNGFR